MRVHVIESTANPSAAPTFVNQQWCNTATNRIWVAKGTSSVSDWEEITSDDGITQLTGDVTAGPGSGSQSATIASVAITGKTLVTPATGDSLLLSDVSDSGNLKKVTVGSLGGALVAGSNTQVQFNDGGVFGADVDLTYNKTTNVLTSGSFQVGAAYPIKTLSNNNEIIVGSGAAGSISGTTSNLVAIGNNAANSAVGGGDSVLIGSDAGYLFSGSESVGIGNLALSEATNCLTSLGIGFRAFWKSDNPSECVAIGKEAAMFSDGMVQSLCIGPISGASSTNAYICTFIGPQAGQYSSDLNSCIGVGGNALQGCFNATYATAIGNGAALSATNASNSIAIGAFAGGTYDVYTSDIARSILIGSFAGAESPAANDCIFIGYQAGINETVDNITVPAFSIAIGQYARTGGYSNSIAIGNAAMNSAAEQLNIANVLYATGIKTDNTPDATPTASGKFGVLTDAPTATLDVEGDAKLGVGGTIFQKLLSATATLNFPSIGANSTAALTMTVTGATVGASVHLGAPDTLESGLTFCGFVSAADTVTVRVHNASGGSLDPASATWRATVINF